MSVPVTRIHQIEVTSRCNLACVYCPHPKLKREKADMSMDTFLETMYHVAYYDSQGTQPELSLTGMGESLLHPDFMVMCNHARSMYDKRILLSTNGLLLTDEMAAEFKDLNIDIYVSLHRQDIAARAINIAQKHGILANVNAGFVTSAINWAGQVDWEDTAPVIPCVYLTEGWATVLQDGSVTTCCMDAEGLSVSGHVNDSLGSLWLEKKPLCDSCSQVVPEKALPDYEKSA